MIEEQLPATSAVTNIAVQVELARLTGRIDQVITDHERRLTILETRQAGTGTRVAAIAGPIVAVVALVMSVAQGITWN